MAGLRVEGNVSGNVAEVDADNNVLVNPPGYDSGGVERGGGDVNAGAAAIFSEVDAGTKNAVREVLSPEVDKDYRLRVAHDNWMDQETFSDTAQNTSKFTHLFTTLTATESASGLLTNSGGITTTTTGMTFGTFAQFPVGGTQTIVCETAVAFSAQPNANTVIDFGLFQRGAATGYAPADGIYFRMTTAGIFGVVTTNGVETTSAVFPLALGAGTFAYTNNAVNRFLIQANNVSVSFWINNYKYAEIVTAVGEEFPCLSRALPWSIRHAIVGGAAGAVTQALVKGYRVFIRGPVYADSLHTIGNRVYGTYQGLSGGTMGQLATLPLNTNPTAAAPSGTALTANLPAGLGGQGVATAAGTSANDLIFGSYQVPAGSPTIQGRRLAVRGVFIDALNTGAAVATTATIIQWSLAFGHTAASLATAESGSFATTTGTTKSPRRIALGFQGWAIGAAIGAPPAQGRLFIDLGDAPIYINPGEFIALVGKWFIGTATASQTITYVWQPIYAWE